MSCEVISRHHVRGRGLIVVMTEDEAARRVTVPRHCVLVVMLGRPCWSMVGEHSPDVRGETRRRWSASDDGVLLVQTACASMGIDLSASDTAMFRTPEEVEAELYG